MTFWTNKCIHFDTNKLVDFVFAITAISFGAGEPGYQKESLICSTSWYG